MTEARREPRNDRARAWVERGLLALVLAAALGLRLHGVDFGLPALNDPDEPLFMMTAFEMLAKPSLNPGWFGHPATTTFYSLALVLLAVALIGIASRRFADIKAFGDAAYADPGLVWLPARLMTVACGVLCVFLVHRIGRRLGDARLGIVAALFLALNAVHVVYSQIIRTDVQASVFMLLGTLAAISVLERGRMRDYVLAGVFAGLACATKWPTALILLNALCAGLFRLRADRGEWRRIVAMGASALAALLAASPYLVLDYPTVLANLVHEARPLHPGATGDGFVSNFAWYMRETLVSSFGVAGVLLIVIGLVRATRERRWLLAVLPAPLAFLMAICAQSLLWERWIVPLLPFAALLAALGFCTICDAIQGKAARRLRWLKPAAALLLALPMTQAAWTRATVHANDTRQIAAAWVRAHVPAGRSILVEHAAIDLLDRPGKLLFPLGTLGCVDARQVLAGQIRYSKVETARAGRPIVDIGHVDETLLDSCRADYAIFTYYGRYAERPRDFAAELARYERLRGGRPFAVVIRPRPGISSGPVVQIVRVRR